MSCWLRAMPSPSMDWRAAHTVMPVIATKNSRTITKATPFWVRERGLNHQANACAGEQEPNRQQHDQGRGESLANRTRLKHRLGRHRNIVLDIGQTVAFLQDDLAILNDGNSHTRDIGALHLREDGVVQRIGM